MDSRSGKNCVGWLAKAESEMPTSGDLKAGESLFHHPTGISTDTPPTLPRTNWPSPQFKWQEWSTRMIEWGQKSNPNGFKQNPDKSLDQNLTPPRPKKKIPSHKIFQKALNDITQN